MTKDIFEMEGIKFISNSDIEHYRIDTLLSKEPETIAWIQSFSNRVNSFIDVGSNMGVYSLYAAMNHKKINIYSFEVYTPTFYLMYENIKLNDFKNITPINAGLFKETKMTELVINDERAAGSGNQIVENTEKFSDKVFTISLDDFTSMFNISYPFNIKIDVDGLEKEIIEGLENNLKDKKVNSLLVELDFDDNAKDIINYLNSLGYVEDKKFTNLRNHSDERRKKQNSMISNKIFKLGD